LRHQEINGAQDPPICASAAYSVIGGFVRSIETNLNKICGFAYLVSVSGNPQPIGE
jgi:hypothetical protein